jgi:hypothetical protein
MPPTFLQPDEPDPTADPGTRAFRLAVLNGYCDIEEARLVLDAIEADENGLGGRSRTVNGAVDASFVLAIASEALDRGAVSHHDLISALERVGIDATQSPRDTIRISDIALIGDLPSERTTVPDGEGDGGSGVGP